MKADVQAVILFPRSGNQLLELFFKTARQKNKQDKEPKRLFVSRACLAYEVSSTEGVGKENMPSQFVVEFLQ